MDWRLIMQVSVRLEVLDTCGRTDTLCGISELGFDQFSLANMQVSVRSVVLGHLRTDGQVCEIWELEIGSLVKKHRCR
jgi:hypothetical protein